MKWRFEAGLFVCVCVLRVGLFRSLREDGKKKKKKKKKRKKSVRLERVERKGDDVDERED